MIALIDSGICNLGSVVNALERVGAHPRIADNPGAIREATAIILPGVGAFADGMKGLREGGFVDPLREASNAGKPILGICLGMQLLVEQSEEHGRHEGLGLLAGVARRIVTDQPGYRVPNIGWCDVFSKRAGKLYPVAGHVGAFYFVHSYCVETTMVDVAATIDFGGNQLVAAIEHGNICGVQFHPEKSQDCGLDLLARWVSETKTAGRVARR